MPRPVAFSAKQKRQQLQDRRAIKRGDLDPSDARIPTQLNRAAPTGHVKRGAKSLVGGPSLSTTKLRSKFIALTPEYITQTRDLAYSVPLVRPIPDEAAVFPLELLQRDQGKLACPTRPKFRYDQTKREVERNEEGMFAKWLKGTKQIVEDWVGRSDSAADVDRDDDGEAAEQSQLDELASIRSPTWFETNLEVWRQLWRVTESSQIILLLLDARCPPLHIPISLRNYVQNLKPRKEVILILTKSDLVDAEALEGWRVWVKEWWREGLARGAAKGDNGIADEVQVVAVRNYDTNLLYNDKPRHRPDLPEASLAELIVALQTAHDRLLIQPAPIAEAGPSKKWPPSVRSQVDWQLLSQGPGSAYPPAGINPATMDLSDEKEVKQSETIGERDPDSEPLTIGLIGQPNVGKSSFLNALLGESRVRASKTPGKTKHFQTIYWGWKKEVKIVDCPGLVCPSLVGLEIQALCGVLPISQIPSLPACILAAARLLPLETICRIPRPAESPTATYADKRTWRTPRDADAARQREEAQREVWTAGMIMDARAIDRGFTTAKTARPDANRAANGMMSLLADGRVRWCFFPPPASPSGESPHRDGKGIWLGEFHSDDPSHSPEVSSQDEGEEVDDDYDEDLDWAIRDSSRPSGRGSRTTKNGRRGDGDETPSSEDDGEADEKERVAGEIDKGFFAALELEDAEESDEDEIEVQVEHDESDADSAGVAGGDEVNGAREGRV